MIVRASARIQSNTGGVLLPIKLAGGAEKPVANPSMKFHCRLAPLVTKLTSSRLESPTSPSQIRPVGGSYCIECGLRTPSAKYSSSTVPLVLMKGLSFGTKYSCVALGGQPAGKLEWLCG